MRLQRLFFLIFTVLLLAACEEVSTDPNSPTSVPLVQDRRSPMPSEQQPSRPDDLETARVVEVIDGDTFILEGDRTVRMIGINAPERDQYLYREATDTLTDWLEGQTVGLEPGAEAMDRFDRELYYVWLDDQLVNWQMVREGLANRLAIAPNIQYDVYIAQAETFAQEEGVGLWQSAGVSLEIVMVMADPPGPDDENINGEYVQIANRGSSAVNLDGFMLYDDHRTTYTFDNFTLQPNQRVSIYSGCGRDTSTDLYWCEDTPVWSNGGDTAVLTDAEGRYIDNYVIEGR